MTIKRIVAFVAIVVAAHGCKSPGSAEESSIKSVVTEGGEGAGATVYFAEGGNVFRFSCPAAVMNALTENDSLDDPNLVRSRCQEKPAASGTMALGSFGESLKAAYLKSVEDSELNPQEDAVLSHLMTMLPATGGARKPMRLSLHESRAMTTIEGRFVQLFDEVFDNKAAPTEVQEAVSSGGSLGLANVATTVGSLKFRSNFQGGMPVQLTVQATDATPVDTLRMKITLDPSGTCRTTVVGIAGVVASTPQGAVEVPVKAHPIKVGAFQVNNGTRVAIKSVRVTVRKPMLSFAQRCILTVSGEAEDQNPPPPPPPADRDAKMKKMMAQRGHRMWHYLWHGIRNSWPRMTNSQRNQVRTVLGQGWGRENTETQTAPQPHKGEEFLHMHRVMIGMVKQQLGTQMYETWKDIPAPNSTQYPLPSVDNGFQGNDVYQSLRGWHAQANDEARMRTMTLGQYGEWIETTLHNTFHMRWADDARANPDVMAGGLFSQPRPEWDLPSNDYLGDTYSSHVNPIFWRLHGYVDDHIEAWLKANNFTSISENCGTTSKCYQWKRTWTGPLPMSTPTLASAQAADRDLPQAMAASAPHESTRGMNEGVDADAFRRLNKSLARMINDNSNMFPVALTESMGAD